MQALVRLFHELCTHDANQVLEAEPNLAVLVASPTFHGLWRNSKLMARCGGHLIFGVAALWASADRLAESETWALDSLSKFSGATTCTLDARNPVCPAYFSAVIACSNLLSQARGCQLVALVSAMRQLGKTVNKPTLKDKEAVGIMKAIHEALSPAQISGVEAGVGPSVPTVQPVQATAAETLAALMQVAQLPGVSTGIMWHQCMTAVAMTLRLICSHSSDEVAAELQAVAVGTGWLPMRATLDGRDYSEEEDASSLRPPAAAAAAAAGVSDVTLPQVAKPARSGGRGDMEVTLTNDISDQTLIQEYGLPLPLHLLPEASTLSKLLSDPAQAAAEVQVTSTANAAFAQKQGNVCVGVLEAFAGRIRSLCTTAVARGLHQKMEADAGQRTDALVLSKAEATSAAEGWRETAIPDILDARSSWGFLRDLQHFVVAPFGTGIRPAAVGAIVALLGCPCSLPRAWVVDIARVIITAAADTDGGLTAATYDALTTLCIWRLPLADVTSLILDNMCGTTTPLQGPPLPAVMAIASSIIGLVGSSPPTLASMSSVAPPRLQRTLLWLVQAMRHARGSSSDGSAGSEKLTKALLSELRSREVSHMFVQPVGMRPQAWLHLGQALGVALQHRNEQVRDAAAVALGEALSLAGDSPALTEMMQDVDLLKAGRMVSAWAQEADNAKRGKAPAARASKPPRGVKTVPRATRMRRTERLSAAPSPPTLPLSISPAQLPSKVLVFGGSSDADAVEVQSLLEMPLLEQSTSLWRHLGLEMPPSPFNLAFVPSLRHLSERKLALQILEQESHAVAMGDEEAEPAVGEVVAAAGNLLYTAVELRAYKLQLVCLLLLRRHARIVAQIHMVQALPTDIQKIMSRYSIPNKAAVVSFASHRRAIRAAAAADLTESTFLTSLSSMWGMKEMQPQLVAFFRANFRGVLSSIGDPLPELVGAGPDQWSVSAPKPTAGHQASAPTVSGARPAGVLIMAAGQISASRFSCLGVPCSFMAAVLAPGDVEGGPAQQDAFLLFGMWLRDAVSQQQDTLSGEKAVYGGSRSHSLQLPPGVLEEEVRAVAWDCLRPDQISVPHLSALAQAFPIAFAMLDANKILLRFQRH